MSPNLKRNTIKSLIIPSRNRFALQFPESPRPRGGIRPQTEELTERLESFGVLHWLDSEIEATVEKYSDAGSRPGKLQAGNAWRNLKVILGNASELQAVGLLGAMLRFANTDENERARLLFRAYVPLSLEHDASGEYIGVETLSQLTDHDKSLQLLRRTLRRWCDWIESVAHWRVHASFHGGFRTQMLGDQALILLWPLAKRNGWEPAELLGTISMVSKRPANCFFESEQELVGAAEALGLRFHNTRSRRQLRSSDDFLTSSIAIRYSQFWNSY